MAQPSTAFCYFPFMHFCQCSSLNQHPCDCMHCMHLQTYLRKNWLYLKKTRTDFWNIRLQSYHPLRTAKWRWASKTILLDGNCASSVPWKSLALRSGKKGNTASTLTSTLNLRPSSDGWNLPNIWAEGALLFDLWISLAFVLRSANGSASRFLCFTSCSKMIMYSALLPFFFLGDVPITNSSSCLSSFQVVSKLQYHPQSFKWLLVPLSYVSKVLCSIDLPLMLRYTTVNQP